MGSIILVQTIKGVLLMPITTQFTCNNPLKVSHKTFGFHNIYFGIGGGGNCIALTKLRRNTIPTSFCDNIISYKTNKCFLNTYPMLIISWQL
jgi:hypothetical protein